MNKIESGMQFKRKVVKLSKRNMDADISLSCTQNNNNNSNDNNNNGNNNNSNNNIISLWILLCGEYCYEC
ncbi:unnamed protein product [Schistosoma margrebowiei]|uniref:Uncharacterized protein n=1 Tax=Schistosoma margrebowiei TaxID=48269 RepID=A0A183M2L3_9TREM|nr:unnamed protein product [Schistosoma margrebowiei]